MRERILALLALGKTYSEIVAEIGCAKSTVSYHARSVREPANYKVHNWDHVQQYYDEGNGIRECRRQFGICTGVWYNAKKAGKIITLDDNRIPLEDLLVVGRAETSRNHLKMRLIEAGLMEMKCGRCGITDWLDAPLSMALHHINGIGCDNRLHNLLLLCPNCHNQTENFAGKNTRKCRKKRENNSQ